MAAMAYLLLSTRDRLSVRAIESRPLRFLGKYSYGMYVVQLPLVTMFPLSAWTDWLPSDAIVRSIFYIGGMFGLITLIAFLSFHLLESRFLKLKKSFQ
jgi:peptidoglycan/LPS O-acetylase OafA/YrhL